MKHKKFSILIVDDVEANVLFLKEILGGEYNISVASSGKEALAKVDSIEKPDLILLDIIMPEMDGMEVLRQLKTKESTKDIPIIFITMKDNDIDEEEGLLAGAVDYITKPIKPIVVKARIRTQLLSKYKHDKLMELALFDSLTGLHNREYVLKHGLSKCSQANRHGNDLSVVMLDIDNFKHINDTYGHIKGDEVLSAVGELLSLIENRSEDMIGRYGGEEFIMLLDNCNAESAKNKVEGIRKSIESMNINGLHVTASFGIAQLNSEYKNFNDLLDMADKAMYYAKTHGKNTTYIYEEDTVVVEAIN